jgi:hypothetical protein
VSQPFSFKSNLDLLEVYLTELKTFLEDDQVPDKNTYQFDRTLVSMIETCLVMKVHHDVPEADFEPNLLEHLTLRGKGFTYAQQQIILVSPDDDETALPGENNEP